MANPNFICPHCKGQLKIIPQGRANPSRHVSEFENVADFTPPSNPVKKLLWFLKGNIPYIPSQPRPTDMTIQIEVWDKSINKVNFDHMDKRITIGIVQQIGQMMANGHVWSRDNLVRHTALSENSVRVVVSEFKRLNYLEVTRNNRSIITPGGARFLRNVLRV